MYKHIILITLLYLVPAIVSGTPKSYGNVTVSRLVKVYDGDTIMVDIDYWPGIVGENISVRILGIDAPEIRTKDLHEKELAIKAKEAMQLIFSNAKHIVLKNIKRDKYFRILSDVYVDGVNVSETMLKTKLVHAYDGKTKKGWD